MKKQLINIPLWIIPIGLILYLSLILRLININYNSPFNDEAIYIVIGKLGVFQGDWVTLNPSSWMAGHPYAYPAITALASTFGGIIGSRVLNVIFGVLTIEAIFVLTTLLFKPEQKSKYLAGVISAALIGGSAVSMYVSRLATYDAPSFYFFFLSLGLLLTAQRKTDKSGKWYFLAFLSLFIATMFKIIVGIFIPFIFLFSFYQARKIGKENFSFYLKYFLAPFILLFSFFLITNLNFLNVFLQTQAARENIDYPTILSYLWNNSSYLIGFAALGTLGMLLTKDFRKWAILAFCSLLIVAVHLYSRRLATFDKHIFLFLSFASIIAGVGITNLIILIKNRWLQASALIILGVFLVYYWVFSYLDAQKFNSDWPNGYVIQTYLQRNVKPGDKILAEEGAAVLLDIYDQNHPVNTTTFDWLKYGNVETDSAYGMAVRDGYFNYIQLLDNDSQKDDRGIKIHNEVVQNLSPNYELSFQKDNFEVYKRKF